MARCLTLNASYEPVALVTVKRAIVLVVSEKAEIVEANLERRFRSERAEYPYPLVIRLVKYVEIPRRLRKHVTNAILFARDNYRCQYCGSRASITDLTYDHVVPRSRGGLTEWTNIVTCCYLCNRKKGGRTPREAHMTLLAQPTQPNWVPAVAIRISLRSIPDAWTDYLYWTGELEKDSS